jgi:hypothetical protein
MVQPMMLPKLLVNASNAISNRNKGCLNVRCGQIISAPSRKPGFAG